MEGEKTGREELRETGRGGEGGRGRKEIGNEGGIETKKH